MSGKMKITNEELDQMCNEVAAEYGVDLNDPTTFKKIKSDLPKKASRTKTTKNQKDKMNNSKMMKLVTANYENPEELNKLFVAYEDLFISSVGTLRNTMRLAALSVVKQKYPNAIIAKKTDKIKYIILNPNETT